MFNDEWFSTRVNFVPQEVTKYLQTSLFVRAEGVSVACSRDSLGMLLTLHDPAIKNCLAPNVSRGLETCSGPILRPGITTLWKGLVWSLGWLNTMLALEGMAFMREVLGGLQWSWAGWTGVLKSLYLIGGNEQ